MFRTHDTKTRTNGNPVDFVLDVVVVVVVVVIIVVVCVVVIPLLKLKQLLFSDCISVLRNKVQGNTCTVSYRLQMLTQFI